MNILSEYISIAFLSYLLGAVPFGLLIGKINGIDIRKHGSGNIGATNVLRAVGKKWGITCFILDFLKGLIPVLTVKFLLRNEIIHVPDDFAIIISAFAAVSGHIWSVFIKFKGGKGIATSAGALAALVPVPLLTAAFFWALIFTTTRYVSLASIIASAILPLCAFVLSICGISQVSTVLQLFLVFIAAIAITKHSTNIKRLLNGTEHRFSQKKKA